MHSVIFLTSCLSDVHGYTFVVSFVKLWSDAGMKRTIIHDRILIENAETPVETISN